MRLGGSPMRFGGSDRCEYSIKIEFAALGYNSAPRQKNKRGYKSEFV